MRKTFTLIVVLVLSICFSEAYAQTEDLLAINTPRHGQTIFSPESASDPFDMKKRRRKKPKRRKGKRGGGGAFEQGAKVATLYYGWPNLMGSIFNVYEFYEGFSASSLGPLGGKFEYGISDKIGLGFTANFLSSGIQYSETGFDSNMNLVEYIYTIDYTSFSFNLRFNYHYLVREKIDLYVGLGPGYSYKNLSYGSTDPDFIDDGSLVVSLMPVSFEGTAGMRFYFTPNIGIFTEVGITKGIVQGGLVAKF